MPRKPNEAPISCQHFTWRLFQRDGVYYADGRAVARNLGKHSLGTRDKREALENLQRLDLCKAVEFGLADEIPPAVSATISIVEGWQQFDAFCARSPVMGGVSPNTLKRYRAVREKHKKFCSQHGIQAWVDFDKSALQKYGNWLSKNKADRTVFFELTLLKSISRWLVEQGHLPAGSELKYSLRKPQGTDTYCYATSEVTAMIGRCRNTAGLAWLANVIVALVHTGLRISELAGLRWSDVNLQQNLLTVADERSSSRKRRQGVARTTKGRRSRTIPIHQELKNLLAGLPRHPDGYVFRAARGGRLRSRNVLQAFIDDVIEPLKARFPVPDGEIGFERGRLHGFRHYFCSQAFLCGASEGEIKEWLGHADSKMVEHYRHLRDEDAQRKMARIDFLGRPAGEDRPSGVA